MVEVRLITEDSMIQRNTDEHTPKKSLFYKEALPLARSDKPPISMSSRPKKDVNFQRIFESFHMKRSTSKTLLLLFLFSWGCGTQMAAAPTIPSNANNVKKRQLYMDYRLSGSGDWFGGWKWTRKDGTYEFGGIENLAAISRETQDIYDASEDRSTALSVVSGIGGFIIGFTLGYNLTASGENTMPEGTQVGLYAAGGGLFALSLFLGAVWSDPCEDFALAYNLALLEKLGAYKTETKAVTSSKAVRLKLTATGLALVF
jgi:hypothetical protein